MIPTLKTLLRSRASLVASSICSTLKTLTNSTLWVLFSALKDHTRFFFQCVALLEILPTAVSVLNVTADYFWNHTVVLTFWSIFLSLVVDCDGSTCFSVERPQFLCCHMFCFLKLTFWFVCRFWIRPGNTLVQVETKGFATHFLLWCSLPTSWLSDTKKTPHWCANIHFHTLRLQICFCVINWVQLCLLTGWQVGKEVSEDLFLRSPNHQCTYQGRACRAASSTLPAGGAGCGRDWLWESRDCSLWVHVTGRMFKNFVKPWPFRLTQFVHRLQSEKQHCYKNMFAAFASGK